MPRRARDPQDRVRRAPSRHTHDSVMTGSANAAQVISGDISISETWEQRVPILTDAFAPVSRSLVIACGALAREILSLYPQWRHGPIDITCLPAKLHNTPQQIVPHMRAKLVELAPRYARIFIAYADCGTGGALDRLLAEYPQAERLEGAHCYATFAGQDIFSDLMEQELGSFFLTDYMVRHFDQLIIKGMGLDQYPALREQYFAHYRRLVYLAQIEDDALRAKAEAAAQKLELEFVYHYTGMGELATFMQQAQDQHTILTPTKEH